METEVRDGETMKSRAKFLAILNAITLAAVIAINYLANSIPINGITTGQVSDSYPNLFAPAPITFSIWGVIYLLLFGFVIYQFVVLKNNEEYTFINKIGPLFIINNLANFLWIIAWHNLYIGISLILTLLILLTLIIIYYKLDIGKKIIHYRSKLFVDVPFSIYLGWASVATIANVTTYLVDINWEGFNISEPLWTVIVIIIAVILALIYQKKYNDICFSLVITWALFGIFLERNSADLIYMSIISISALGASLTLISAVNKIIKKEVY